MIRAIYKGKGKNYAVMTVSDNVAKFTVLNLKDRSVNVCSMPLRNESDFVKFNRLKKATYQELEDALKEDVKKRMVKINKITDKIVDATNEILNPEYRHFVYEYESDIKPLLTEGMLKTLGLYQLLYTLADNHIYDELICIDEDLANISFLEPKKLRNEEILDVLLDENYCECVVKSKKYVFGLELEDLEEDLEDEKKD